MCQKKKKNRNFRFFFLQYPLKTELIAKKHTKFDSNCQVQEQKWGGIKVITEVKYLLKA